jgi:aspartate aminotransferase
MGISEKVKNKLATGSYIRKMFEEGIALKKKYGDEKVFDLSIGNPIFEPPDQFKNELKRLVKQPVPGMHLAVEEGGDSETRGTIAYQLTHDTGIQFDSKSIVMAFGAAGAVNIAFKTLLNPGEEVISFTPCYFEYENYADNHEGVIKYIPSDQNFIPDFEALEAGITPNTKIVIINSPNNPTGVVYSSAVLKQIAEIITQKSAKLKTRIYIVSDDVYSKLYCGGEQCPRILNYYPHTIVTTSFSKDLSIPGERIGYVAVHPECEDAKTIIRGLSYSNRVMGFISAPSIMQYAIRNLQNVSVSINEYQRKRDFLYENLIKMGYSVTKPQGAFYIFPKTPIKNDEAFVQELKDLLVLTTPGFIFQSPGYFRISYCLDNKVIEGSLSGLRKAIEKYK